VATKRGYEEAELIQNRAPVLLSGGTEDERRLWAEEAASFFPAEGPLREVKGLAELRGALTQARGVIYLPDVLKLPVEAQALLVRCFVYQEERPKVVVGVVGSADGARERGALTEELHYRLHLGRVDLSQEAVRAQVAKRRELRPVPKPAPAARPGTRPPTGGAKVLNVAKPLSATTPPAVAAAKPAPVAVPAPAAEAAPAAPAAKAAPKAPAGGASRRAPGSRAARG
jgi:hypothetical protein